VVSTPVSHGRENTTPVPLISAAQNGSVPRAIYVPVREVATASETVDPLEFGRGVVLGAWIIFVQAEVNNVIVSPKKIVYQREEFIICMLKYKPIVYSSVRK
jgi:hypothetical protein